MSLAGSGPGGRVRYSKVERECLVFVIADVHPDGGADFFSQEVGEVRWFPFVPQPAERRAALALLRSRPAVGESAWPLLFAGDPVD
ncbi:MAG TPA: hypothetical protein VGS58_02405 [Candidatus Sulfopaludibacter sp.]|nr:hypothetical protein [Candidatus Sulfopaludibacter sp.]